MIQLYPTAEGPRFVKGHAVSLALVGMSSVLFAFMSWYLSQKNRRRERGEEDEKVANMSESEIDELGDASPRYIFTI